MKENNTKVLEEKLAAVRKKIDSSKTEILNCKGQCHEIEKTKGRLDQWEAIWDELEKIEELVKEELNTNTKEKTK